MGFCASGADGIAINICAYPGFGFGGRNSAGFLLVNFNFCLLIWLQFKADSWSSPQLTQSLDHCVQAYDRPYI